MGDRRWGFEELHDREFQEIVGRRPAREPAETSDTVASQNADGVVTVHVTSGGEVVSVRLPPTVRGSWDIGHGRRAEYSVSSWCRSRVAC